MPILVLITDTAIKVPKIYEPPSPRKRVALGKLNLRNIINIKIAQNSKRAKLFSLKKLIKNKLVIIIKECMPSNPLYPSIKLAPLIMNKKHLHMLLYQILYKKNKQKNRSNYTTSIIINVSYLLLTLPAIYFFKSNIFCKYYLLTLILVYIFSYKIAHEKSH